ncbi:MAG: M20/M25/M40 family metallo-hydrolase [Anaerolineae bacterium]|nr:M20/M25/M40 family metallo-hydrolase [Anaerolineae bacterium]
MKNTVGELFKTINWSDLDSLKDWVIDFGIKVQQIPAPTFEEGVRAEFMEQTFIDCGLQQVERDELNNVYGLLPGKDHDASALMITAHTDTVFDAQTDLAVRYEDDLIYGPGLGDNCMGLAGMIGFIKWLKDHDIPPKTDIWFVATVGEEGLGDLCGMRAAFAKLKDRVGAVINLEGLAFGYVYHAGIAVHRLKVTATSGGGHSWVHYGRESSIHALVQLATRITHIAIPNNPRSSLNIGVINGGQGINVIAPSAEFWLDLRSESQIELERLKQHVHHLIQTANTDEVKFDAEIVGDRPAGSIPIEHPLIVGAMEILELLGVIGGLEIGSTDGNVPLHAGCPTVTIGITCGANAHRLDEYIETEPVYQGMQQLIVLTLATLDYLASQSL